MFTLQLIILNCLLKGHARSNVQDKLQNDYKFFGHFHQHDQRLHHSVYICPEAIFFLSVMHKYWSLFWSIPECSASVHIQTLFYLTLHCLLGWITFN